MTLPALKHGADIRSITAHANRLGREFNRLGQDMFPPIYGTDTGSATAYAIAPVPGISQYIVGQLFAFKATNANSGTTPTLNVNSKGAGTITRNDGTALVAGDIALNAWVMVECTSTTPTFALLTTPGALLLAAPAITNTGATVYLGADVPLNNTANFFSGPNTGSIGASGWVVLVLGTAVLDDTAGVAQFELAIFDGTNYHANIVTQNRTGSAPVSAATSAVITLSGATTFTLRARDQSSTSGVLRTTSAASGVANKATNITYVRIA